MQGKKWTDAQKGRTGVRQCSNGYIDVFVGDEEYRRKEKKENK